MKTICIKTNNIENINYLLNLLNTTHVKNVCYSCNKFKYYKNIIIHYTDSSFISKISEFLSFLVINKYEEKLIKRLIFTNYFYFDVQERNTVLEIALNLLTENESLYIDNRQKIIYNAFYKYLLENNKIVLDGFINFRLKEYLDLLNSTLDDSVNCFIVEKEYWEFISLLKVYIKSEPTSIEEVHLIYSNSESVLLNKNKEIIDIDEDAFKAKYLSDITFSSNDYTLNTLLNLVPKKIFIHITDGLFDEFINTLQLIFEGRVEICAVSIGTEFFDK
ncbi:MAG: putative sporulation protein YtxC [Clostridia bacterium]|nr:putative sporulation protein YtxC [Clostridia bacterium]